VGKKNMILMDFLNDVYIPQKLLGKSPKTMRLYRVSVRKLDSFLDRPARLNDLNDDMFARFLAWRLETTLKASVEKDRCQLAAVWRFAFMKGLVKEPSFLPIIPSPAKTPRAWKIEELERLFNACRQTEGAFADKKDGLWVCRRDSTIAMV